MQNINQKSPIGSELEHVKQKRCSSGAYDWWTDSSYPATAWAVSVPTTAWGGGGRIRPPPLLSRKRMDVERRTRRHSKDLDETLPNNFRKFKIEVTCQVKVRSKVKIGCIQVVVRRDLKRSIFRPKLSICTPKDQAKVLTSEIVSYFAQVKVKVRSEKVTKPKIFKCVVWHMFYGPFWTKNSIVTVILQFDLIWMKKMRKSIQGHVKKVKKRSNFQNLFSWKQRRVSEAEPPQQSNGTISFPVSGL